MTLSKAAIRTAEAPAAIGPYSQAVRSGDLLYTSGQVGFDPASGTLVPEGVEAETRQVLRNLEAILHAAQLSLADVVKTTVFLADMNDFAKVNAIYEEAFEASEVMPARSTVQVARLPRDARVEIEAIARYDGALLGSNEPVEEPSNG